MAIGLGMGAWWLAVGYIGLDHQIEVLVEDYTSAWNAGDGESVVAMMTPTGRHVSSSVTDEEYSGDELANLVSSLHEDFQFDLTLLGEPLIIEGPIYYLVAVPTEGNRIGMGFQFFRIVEYHGELLISFHGFME